MKKSILLALFITASFFTANAQYTMLSDFTGNGASTGTYPQYDQNLISDGTFLYGMTACGGTNNLGTLFKIMPDGTGYSKLLDFADVANGSYPCGSLISDGTFLYGMTYQGGTNGQGTLFKIMPDGTGYSKLLDFAGATNGGYPYGSLIS
ncbi:MAG: choice-of-anchor tandem repeat GloVer-containing protein, partial [Bacteroidales bacterium]